MKSLQLALLCGFAAHAANPALQEEGRRVFAASCSVGYCHGVEGAPGKGPRLRDRTWNRRYLYNTIEEGIPGSSMPSWRGRLSEHSIDAVIAYVLSISIEQGKEQTGIAGATDPAVTKAAISQQAALGRSLFFDLTKDRNCGVCHRIEESGTAVARPFTNLASESEQDLVKQILKAPSGVKSLKVMTSDGETICGVEAAQGVGWLRIYDLDGKGPAVLRTIDSGSIRQLGQCASLDLHRENRSWYTQEEMIRIVVFLKSSPSGKPQATEVQ